ncbi:chromate transporter (plasmid) [Paraburkholderia sp. PREW-6R]|uniref:chromate transporter n=1 Tax=Paraburkholderia sp. PREW-6R TaxID=3141544 RepID=UPI0031F5837C
MTLQRTSTHIQRSKSSRPSFFRAEEPPAAASLWKLFCTIFLLSALSWGGLALIAQLEHRYVVEEARLSRRAFSDLTTLAWMIPGPVGCNVAIQVGYVIGGRAGAWVAGFASVLPFMLLMPMLGAFYRAPFVQAASSASMLDHLRVVLAALIAVTWYRQAQTVVWGRLELVAAFACCAVLAVAQGALAYVLVLGGGFLAGWCTAETRPGRLQLQWTTWDRLLLSLLAALVVLFCMPVPASWQARLLWIRLGGAGLVLFGGGFTALPILKTLFVTPVTGISESDFTLAFALSPASPGPLLNVVPFLGYLIHRWPGAIVATFALFAPSGCLVILARRHLQTLEADPRFERGMRVLRSVASTFLAVAAVKIFCHVPHHPVFAVTAIFSAVCLGRRLMPAYVVYAIVAIACICASALTHGAPL